MEADINTEVALLKKEVSDIKVIFSRLDVAIEKITDVSSCVNRMLAVHEEKIANQEEAQSRANTEFTTDIKELHSRVTSNYKELTEMITEQHKEQAQQMQELRNELGEDFVDFLGYSPLLSSIDVKLNANYANPDSLLKIKNQLQKNTNVFEVYYQEDLVEKINSNVNRITIFLLAFCSLLLIIAFVLINNTIRLSVYSKRFLIRTMRLVGAKNSFIKKPFLINSLYQGLYGAIFAVFMLIGSLQLIQKEAMHILNISDLKVIGTVFLLIFIFGIFISWISTYLSVKKYIKLTEHKLYK